MSNGSDGQGTPSLTIDSPNGGGPYLAGQQFELQWDSTGLDDEELLDIVLVRENGVGGFEDVSLLATNVANTGVCELEFPAVAMGDEPYYFQIRTVDRSVSVLSDPLLVESTGFVETWDNGIDPDRWGVYLKKWGGGNNGCVPELVRIGQDTVNGSVRNVLVLTGHGDDYQGTVQGVTKEHGQYVRIPASTRVGACIVTRESFASGRYDITMKIGNGNLPLRGGMCVSAWMFHYEEHVAGDDPSLPNPDDPLYQPTYRRNGGDFWYSVVNSEIDAPELGHANRGDYVQGWYNAYLSDLDAAASYNQFTLDRGNDVRDGQYHTYSFEWRTRLVDVPDITDQDVIAKNGYYYIAKPGHTYQGMASIKQDGNYRVCAGKEVVCLFDGTEIGRIAETTVSAVAARLIVGIWFPSWSGAAPWDETDVYVSRIAITPFGDPGDVFNQAETYPEDGIVDPLP